MARTLEYIEQVDKGPTFLAGNETAEDRGAVDQPSTQTRWSVGLFKETDPTAARTRRDTMKIFHAEHHKKNPPSSKAGL